jgi:predicted RNA binding protein YcfA (HicA-like mRNA interferase family)
MPKLKVLSGAEVLKIFFLFGFLKKSQKGSHIKIKRKIEEREQILTIPNHDTLDKGTLKAIIKQASAFISENELKKYFYND